MVKNVNGSLLLLTAVTLVLFAANSVICKLALGYGAIDPASFTAIRLTSGAAILILLLNFSRSTQKSTFSISWLSAGMLFLYAACFSYAYMTLEAGTGALILFSAVQLTMILSAVVSGERPKVLVWTGGLVAFSGLIYLVSPGFISPSASGSFLMIIAGISWGIYSIKGKKAQHPLSDTRNNFLGAVVFSGFLLLPLCLQGHISIFGVWLSIISGVLCSGIGYVLWYVVVKRMKTIQAGIVQLFVPVLASLGGVLFLEELITLRLIVSTVIILGGICLSNVGQTYSGSKKKCGRS